MMSRALSLLASRTCGGLSRAFSALPEAVADPFARSGEAVRLSYANGSPILLKLPDRQWGPSLSLSAHEVEDIAGETPERVAVVRNVFCADSGEVMTLAQTVAAICNNSIAVASEVASPASRLLVDEYQQSKDGSYHLTSMATDLFRMMRREGLRVSLVPDVMAATTGVYNGSRGAQKGLRQSTNEVLMVAPTAFGFNAETAEDNSFMHSSVDSTQENDAAVPHRKQVLREFAGLHHQLSDVAGVNIALFQHSQEHRTPDACFPNNWFSTHPAGEGAGNLQDSTLVLYPMKAPSRQRERRPDILDIIRSRGYGRTLDYSSEEQNRRFFEGTGSLVIDRINGVAYVALSERAHKGLAERWAADMGYRDLVTFHSRDSENKIVYHTNVMMAIGTDVAVVCSESVHDDKERQHLLARLSASHSVVDITKQQMGHLCGNVLELEDGRGLPVFAMSSQAYQAFTEDQRRQLRKHVAELHHAPIDTIEHIGGGGVRCALAELF